jgi:hypothetical protein
MRALIQTHHHAGVCSDLVFLRGRRGSSVHARPPRPPTPAAAGLGAAAAAGTATAASGFPQGVPDAGRTSLTPTLLAVIDRLSSSPVSLPADPAGPCCPAPAQGSSAVPRPQLAYPPFFPLLAKRSELLGDASGESLWNGGAWVRRCQANRARERGQVGASTG